MNITLIPYSAPAAYLFLPNSTAIYPVKGCATYVHMIHTYISGSYKLHTYHHTAIPPYHHTQTVAACQHQHINTGLSHHSPPCFQKSSNESFHKYSRKRSRAVDYAKHKADILLNQSPRRDGISRTYRCVYLHKLVR